MIKTGGDNSTFRWIDVIREWLSDVRAGMTATGPDDLEVPESLRGAAMESRSTTRIDRAGREVERTEDVEGRAEELAKFCDGLALRIRGDVSVDSVDALSLLDVAAEIRRLQSDLDEPLSVASARGTVRWMYSESSDCGCCDGPHVFSRAIEFPAGAIHRIEQFNNISGLVWQALRSIPEGTTVEVSVRALGAGGDDE